MNYQQTVFNSVVEKSIVEKSVVEKSIVEKSIVKIGLGSATDIGGGVENQDDSYIIETPEFVVLSVLDGHGSSGKFFANSSKKIMEQKITEKKNALLDDPVNFIHDCFIELHAQLTDELVIHLNSNGYETKIDTDGCVVQKSKYADTWRRTKCGGTTKSMIVLIKSTLKLYIANVGDSDALLCCTSDILSPTDLHTEKDSVSLIVKENPLSNNMVLTGNHSPNNPTEYTRMRTFCPSDKNKLFASAEFIYDNQINDKTYCSPIFRIHENGNPIIIPAIAGNCYYKNVRKEYASYVVTPKHAEQESRLSNTRSLGDHNLKQYGVSCSPEIQSIELLSLFCKLEEEEEEPVLGIVLATDGVWDNWLYKDVSDFIMYDSCLKASASDLENGTQKVADSFMERNMLFSKRNFGQSADNATVVTMYIRKC